MGSRSCWEVAYFFAEPQTGKRRKKTWGKEIERIFVSRLDPTEIQKLQRIDRHEPVWALVFWDFLKVFSTLWYPLFACCATFCPLDWRQNGEIPIVMKTFILLLTVSNELKLFLFWNHIMTPTAPKHATILWECLQKSCPSNQSSANWCDCPTEKKNKRSVNLFTTNRTKIVNIISLHVSLLSKIHGIYWKSHFVLPLYFLTITSWHQPLTPVLKPRFGVLAVLNPKPHPKPLPGAPQPCLLNALNVTKFDVSNLGGSSSAFVCLTFFVFWSVPKRQKVKTHKNPKKNGCAAGLESWFEYGREKPKDFRVSAISIVYVYINPGPYPSFEEKTFWTRDVKFMKMLRPHFGLTSFCWSAMLFWKENSKGPDR